MGFTKRLLEEAEERKFFPTGEIICRRHVHDRFLLGQLPDIPGEVPCILCGRNGRSRVDVDEVRDLVVAVIKTYRRRAIDDLYLDKETENGWALSDHCIEDTADAADSFFEGSLDDDLMEYVRETLEPEQWFDPGVIWLEGAELYLESWKGFRAKLRSTNIGLANLLAGVVDDPRRDWEPAYGVLPSELLPRLWGLVDEVGVRSIPASSEWVRAVHVPLGQPLGAQCLGTAPTVHSTENRMNRAGEPMFYGAADDATAISEIGHLPPNTQTVIGTWVSSRPLTVLDLASLPDPPDLYDVEKAELRWRIKFLSDFAEDVSQPIGPHERVEYRATQVFMDFLRSRASGLDGIIYRSSRTESPCCALEVDNGHCVGSDSSGGSGGGPLQLILDQWRIAP